MCERVTLVTVLNTRSTIFVYYSTVQHVCQLCPQEHVMCMCACNLLSDDVDEATGNDGRQVFVIGTALVRPEDKEPSFGRILVLQVIGGE